MDKNKILNDFLPDKIFDAHMHLYDKSYMDPIVGMPYNATLEDYYQQIEKVFCKRAVWANIIPYPSHKIISDTEKYIEQVDASLYSELDKNTENIGELLVLPKDTEESILIRIKSDQICGFKCYHTLSSAARTFDLDIKDYLPESAFVIANEYKKVITLHMVKDEALSNETNLRYISEMAKKYPDAILVLAHAARSFAAWTGVESVEKLKSIENVWFDFSAICESPAMFQIIKKCGSGRVVWGSDYPISQFKGKYVSIADKFFWLRDFEQPDISKEINMWTVLEENLMAIRQTALMLDMSSREIEGIFYNNAGALFGRARSFKIKSTK